MSHELAEATIDLIEPHVRTWAAAAQRPLVIGICGAQGSGKSTVSAGLAGRLRATGLAVALLSIDDIYLSREERKALASVHPLLRTRGVPGTHDIALGLRSIESCGRAGVTLLPRFSKRNDTREPESAWARIDGPADILLFEGWCVGAVPQAAEALVEPVNALERIEDPDGRWRRYVNYHLGDAYQRLFDRIDRLILLAAPSFDCVAGWRKEQEHKLRASLRPEDLGETLNDAEIDRFVQHYQRITQHILAEMPGRADLAIRLDEERRPIIREDVQ